MDPPSGAGERSAQRRALWTYLRFAAGLAVFILLIQWIVERREIAAERAHRAAVAQAEAEPGMPVTDPALPAGVVEVDLVPVAPELPLEEAASVRAGARRVTWSPGSPARFEGLAADRRLPLSITGPYAVEGASISAPTGARGARLAVRAIPLQPRRPSSDPPGVMPEKRLRADLHRPGVVYLTWLQGRVVVSEQEAPRTPAGALAARIQAEWRAQGSHFDVNDRKLDQAIVRPAPTDSFDDIRFLVEGLLGPKRDMNLGGSNHRVPVFAVEVQASQ